jgi:hypothetical protein
MESIIFSIVLIAVVLYGLFKFVKYSSEERRRIKKDMSDR